MPRNLTMGVPTVVVPLYATPDSDGITSNMSEDSVVVGNYIRETYGRFMPVADEHCHKAGNGTSKSAECPTFVEHVGDGCTPE